MRREFSAPTKRAAYQRSGGTCECHRVPMLSTFGVGCGVRLGNGNTFFEHIIPDNQGGDNDLSNCAALSRTCWKAKTALYDLPVIAKTKRQRDRSRNIKSHSYPPIPGTKRSGWKNNMRGGWERRT